MKTSFGFIFTTIFVLTAPTSARALEWQGNRLETAIVGDLPVHRLIALHGVVRYANDPNDRHALSFMCGASVPFFDTYALTLRYGQEQRWAGSHRSETESVSILFRGWLPEKGLLLRVDMASAIRPEFGPVFRGRYSLDFRLIGREVLGRPIFSELKPAWTGGKTLGFRGRLAPLAADLGLQIEQADFDILGGPHVAITRHGSPWRVELQYLLGHRDRWSHETRTVIRLEF